MRQKRFKNLFLIAALALPGLSGCDGAGRSWSARQTGYFKLLGVTKAWELTDGSGVKVGIVDGGFDYGHPVFNGRLTRAYRYPGALHPGDMRTLAHGTFAASIIGASASGAGGMRGVCPGCAMLGADTGIIEHWAVKRRLEFFRRDPSASAADYERDLQNAKAESEAFNKKWLDYVSSSTAASIKALADAGVKVISMSLMLSGLEGGDLRRVEEAMSYAASKDIVLVIGAGNSAGYTAAYPGGGRNTLVTGCSRGDKAWTITEEHKGRKIRQGTNYGPALDVLAPCEEVVVANPHAPAMYTVKDGPRGPYRAEFTGEYEVYPQGGSSISVPFAAGLAALARAANPALSARETIDLIRRNADDLAPPGRDDRTGWGRINFARTLAAAAGFVPQNKEVRLSIGPDESAGTPP